MDNPVVALALLGAAAGALVGTLLKQIRDDTRQLVGINFDYAEADLPADDWQAPKPPTRKPKPATP